MTDGELISIGEASSILGVSIDTLRRWDRKRKLTSIKSPGGHRNYHRSQIELFLNDLFGLAREWVLKQTDLSPKFYCPNSAAFQTRLTEMQDLLGQAQDLSAIFSLVVAVTLGVLKTLKRVKPELDNDQNALVVAFTEVISGRAPEIRGNGLKFVRKVISENPIGLLFQTGDAELILAKDSSVLDVRPAADSFRGCLALITF
ncbi:MAG: MerR family DNA-binding transcriptional regulator [Candidatus Yanofskybacteria bacterium]|nr:MerR family DNA-binding transcriptional regulator [Candidatus Yanofskybacteria bacterium]